MESKTAIVALRIKNFLSISDVDLKLGRVNQITGKNNQGKTTVLKAIAFCLQGGTDGSMIKHGEDSSEVTVELADSTTITRRLTAGGTQTVRVLRDGMSPAKPQTFLDGLFEASAFNPLELLDPKKRTDAIMQSIPLTLDASKLAQLLLSQCSEGELPPLDYTQHGLKILDQAHSYFYKRRAEANKDTAEKKKRWETYKADLVAPTAPRATQAEVLEAITNATQELHKARDEVKFIQNNLKEIEAANKQADAYERAAEKMAAEVETINSKIEEMLKAVTALRLQPAAPELEPALAKSETAKEKLQSLETSRKDLEIWAAFDKQAAIVTDCEKTYQAAKCFSDKLTLCVETLAGPAKASLMGSAQMPIAGLSYQDGAFLLDGASIDNLSSSKALRLGVAVAKKIANSKPYKLINLDGAELLDEESYAVLHEEMEKDDGYVYFLTKVGEPFKTTGESDKTFVADKGAITEMVMQ